MLLVNVTPGMQGCHPAWSVSFLRVVPQPILRLGGRSVVHRISSLLFFIPLLSVMLIVVLRARQHSVQLYVLLVLQAHVHQARH